MDEEFFDGFAKNAFRFRFLSDSDNAFAKGLRFAIIRLASARPRTTRPLS